MRVLLLASPLYDYYKSVEKALVKSDCLVTTKVHQKTKWYYKIPLFGKLIELYSYTQSSKNHLKYLYNHGNKYDVILFFSYYLFNPYQIDKINRELKIKTIFWAFDSIFAKDKGYGVITSCNYIFTYNKEDEDFLKSKGFYANFLPLCYDPEKYHPIKKTDYLFDIYFIGALRARIDFLEEYLSKLDKGYKISIDGRLNPFFRMYYKKKYPNFFKCYTGKQLNALEINEIYNQSRICLNIQPKQATSGFSIRTFEIYGANSLQVTNGNEKMLKELFIDKSKSILHFDNIETLVTLTKDVLSDYSKYYNQQNQFKNIKNNKHTFYNRIRFILSNIGI